MAKGPSTIFTLPGTLVGSAFCFVVIFGDGVRDAVCALALRPGLRPCLGEILLPIFFGEFPPEEHGNDETGEGEDSGVPKILNIEEKKENAPDC
mmetsp:Transcript_21359/g.34475  ORF Transcript_21359/g.34475 Transcript_21359/m.34475 type:complete len:94 (+) Transcript_21359:556-837(+)